MSGQPKAVIVRDHGGKGTRLEADGWTENQDTDYLTVTSDGKVVATFAPGWSAVMHTTAVHGDVSHDGSAGRLATGESIRTFGQSAYEAYAEHCGWKSIKDEDLPAWADQSPENRAHWEAAAEAAATGVRQAG